MKKFFWFLAVTTDDEARKNRHTKCTLKMNVNSFFLFPVLSISELLIKFLFFSFCIWFMYEQRFKWRTDYDHHTSTKTFSGFGCFLFWPSLIYNEDEHFCLFEFNEKWMRAFSAGLIFTMCFTFRLRAKHTFLMRMKFRVLLKQMQRALILVCACHLFFIC